LEYSNSLVESTANSQQPTVNTPNAHNLASNHLLLL
jgi:hypothetical protein